MCCLLAPTAAMLSFPICKLSVHPSTQKRWTNGSLLCMERKPLWKAAVSIYTPFGPVSRNSDPSWHTASQAYHKRTNDVTGHSTVDQSDLRPYVLAHLELGLSNCATTPADRWMDDRIARNGRVYSPAEPHDHCELSVRSHVIY